MTVKGQVPAGSEFVIDDTVLGQVNMLTYL